MTALFKLFSVELLDVGQFDSAVRTGVERWSQDPGRIVFIDLLVPGTLLVHAGDAGTDLNTLSQDGKRLVSALPAHDRPTHLLVTDLQRFWLYRRDRHYWHGALQFYLAELPEHINDFAFIASIPQIAPRNLPEATEEASNLLVAMREGLLATKYPSADVDTYIIRLLLILSMDHNGTFPRGSFYRLILGCTRQDGSDVGERIAAVFEALDTPNSERQASMTAEVRAFAYINGSVFSDKLKIAYFSQELRLQLLALIAFNWRDVWLELIGRLYQQTAALSPKHRRWSGLHYTPAWLTLQVIEPLFLSALQGEFEQISLRRASEQPRLLHALWDRLVATTILDPACGSGFFLTASYLALRSLETGIIAALLRLDVAMPLASCAPRLSVMQMVGIDRDSTAANIAWASLLLADQRANNELSRLTGRSFSRLPLPSEPPSIHCRDALAIDWASLLPLGHDHFDYIVGNPPFGGAKLLREGGQDVPVPSAQTLKQLRKVEQQFAVNFSRLDLSAAWLIKAADMVQRSEGRTKIALVLTSSFTQGEQVSELWPILFDRYRLDIVFAQRPTRWEGSAAVSVVVLGLAARDAPGIQDFTRRLFDCRHTDTSEKTIKISAQQVPLISAYLRPAATRERAQLIIPSRCKPISDVPTPRVGTKPIDDGHLIIKNPRERDALLAKNPAAKKYLRPYVGAREMLHETVPRRWILVTADTPRAELQKLGEVRKRLRATQEARSKSANAGTWVLAPGEFQITNLPDKPFIGIPEIIDPRRTYLPIGWLTPPTVPSNLLKVLPADPYLFGVLSSRAYMAWLRAIGGTLDAAPRYSIRIVYNNFPWPDVDADQRALIGELGEAVRAARAAQQQKELARAAEEATTLPPDGRTPPFCPLTSLYWSETMPKPLLAAHRALDAAVERLFRPTGFGDNDTDAIVEHLFDRYVARIAEIAS